MDKIDPRAPRAFTIWRYMNGIKQDQLGGAPDIVSATNLAAACMIGLQDWSPNTSREIAVLDVTNVIVAYVGRAPL
jgi:hypothetical protein